MQKKTMFTFLATLVAALALIAAGCGGGDGGNGGGTEAEGDAGGEQGGELGTVEIPEGEPIKIAAIQTISGATASLGEDQVRAIEIAIADRDGELMGHEITLQSEDGGCAAEGGTTAAQRIVSDPQVVGIIGTSCSGAAVPASEIMSEAGLVMISGSNTSPSLTSDLEGTEGEAYQPGYFRTAHNDIVQGQAAAEYVFNELGKKKIATIHDGDPYTEGLATAMGNSFKDLGGEVVLATAINKGDTDMRPVLTEVAAAGAEVIYFPIFQPEADFIAKQAKDVEGTSDAVLFAADGVLSDTFVTIPATEGMYFSGPATPTGGEYEEFVQKYKDEFGEAPIQAFHAHAYDAANVLLNAIEEVAEEGDGGSLTIDRQALREAIGATESFEGLTGTITCDEFGDCADPRIDIVQNTEEQKDIEAVRGNVLFTYEPKDK
ncbi:MAG: branched-chain amino acid ABC transporter substrate-binding protein [Actinobacteria bacterium]|nr:branched-chain amino acid ABC transporter substrate-binding protein [Actinomycetota bacterium]